MAASLNKDRNCLDSLRSYSPHLASRVAREISEAWWRAIAETLIYSIEHSGATEPHTLEREATSFNLRPARVGLILLDDVEDGMVLSAGMLACGEAIDRYSGAAFRDLVPAALSAVRPVQDLLVSGSYVAKLIAAGIRLDAVRHLHLSPLFADRAFMELYIGETEKYLHLIDGSGSKIESFLSHWCRRVRGQER